jgi:alkylation response protein AidB-like acyl-CoA dehydrogenase
VREVSSWDGSAGWNFAIGQGAGLFIAGYLPPEVARSLCVREGCIPGAFAPTGRAIESDGGFTVNGKWGWASTIHQASNVAFLGIVMDGEKPRMMPDGTPARMAFVVPRDQVEVLDTWHTSGMRGTGSTEFVVRDLFVPAERAFLIFFGQRHSDAPQYRMPPTILGVVIASVAVGIAQGCIADFADLASGKTPMLSPGLLRDRASAQHDMARASAMVESSRLYMRELASHMWERAKAGDEITLELRARLRSAVCLAAESAADAVGMLCRSAGGSAIFESLPFERRFRDVNAAMAHITVGRGMMEDAGRVMLGLPPSSPMF